MKKTVFLLCIALLLLCCACGKQETQNGDPSETAPASETAAPVSEQEAQPSAEETTAGGSPNVTAAWSTDDMPAEGTFDEIKVATDEYAVGVTFRTDQPVQDFQVLKLSLTSVSDDGRTEFDSEAVYSMDVLNPDRPLVVYLSFPGDLPTNGISYTDADGVTHFFTLDVSGMDGSLSIHPF